ncbi:MULTISPECIES: MarR family winged helix-turn-helix transcriptional regulator [Acinetobacter]|uniref:MarR family winged helix-turn-helix transcriptional regulator n=1 Tax=Acinetobacter TaxID=469 RepID=UPI00141B9374|nr:MULTISPECIES: MarR family winged helix-turn-helix transcriptional regulator [Acinetobacter]MCS4299138.1 DNA-binding MarR family transcriptional regulator [Acinetobacter guillouiae]MCW2250215.1 DNA-binding MarR family transcriptional regulator [Acinetobacter sp. BIGb0204]NII39318.1 DNA-binding MarR family transcriptional regulator [Acinetobacter sp. BIGb0196]
MNKKYSKFFSSTSDFNLINSPYYWITQTHNQYVKNVDNALKIYGLDNSRRQILLALKSKNKASISDLSKIITCKISTTTKIVHRLRDEGYIGTYSCTLDARFTRVILTYKGERAIQSINEISNAVLAESFNGLPPLQVEKLLNTLQHIFKNLSDTH